ncbi:uncharacterized protein LOC110249786 isoform X2 [Exaiptasia diaphana]|uniref:Uncharacterized protein n=1 Tax=Exaiptasia diaphana TaxID=2652724 RepID=A0A913Y064_EXADI|nr:uncharacterized protein LOC110249786 isoform X2 [Exaiptasia diaphana]
MDHRYSTLPAKGFSTDIGARKRVQLPGDQGKGTSSSLQPGLSSLFHSTPLNKVATPVSTTMASYYTKPRTTNSLYNPPTSMVSARTPRSKSPGRTTSPLGGNRRSISPRRGTSPSRSLSPSKQLSDVDTDTIQRQRRELQLLIGELKDRDRELTDMVQAHQKQIVAWEEDRQRVLTLEKRCSRLESEVKNKTEQIKASQARLKAAEAEEKSKNRELEDTQVQLQQVSEQANTSIHQLQDLEEKNISLTNTMRELSSTIGQLQAREQELSTRLKLKDNDISEASIRLSEMQQKLRRLENYCQDLKKADQTLKTERDQWKDQALANKNEIEKLRGDITKQFSDADEIQAECAQVKQEVLVLQKELFLAGEREKRKDQLLDLQKSKQDRADAELQNLRQICERQQRDISYLQMQLQTNQEAMFKPDDFTSDDKISDYYEEKIDYNLNTDFDNQDAMSTKSSEIDAVKSLSQPVSNYATAGSDFGDDLESLNHEPLPTALSSRPYTNVTAHQSYGGSAPPTYGTTASQNYSTTLPQSYGLTAPQSYGSTVPQSYSTAVSQSYGTTLPQSYETSHQTYYSGQAKPDVYQGIGSLSLADPKTDVQSVDGSYAPYSSGPTLTSTPAASRPNGFTLNTSTPQTNHQDNESSPTSKLHRLLAESRQMVQNLEQVSSYGTPSSPAKQDGSKGTEQYTPPQKHMGSPLTNHVQSKGQGLSAST